MSFISFLYIHPKAYAVRHAVYKYIRSLEISVQYLLYHLFTFLIPILMLYDYVLKQEFYILSSIHTYTIPYPVFSCYTSRALNTKDSIGYTDAAISFLQ